MSKLTPMFPSEIKPVYVGVYCVENNYIHRRGYAYWNGKRWGWTYDTVNRAHDLRSERRDGASQFKTWRGLAVKP